MIVALKCAPESVMQIQELFKTGEASSKLTAPTRGESKEGVSLKTVSEMTMKSGPHPLTK